MYVSFPHPHPTHGHTCIHTVCPSVEWVQVGFGGQPWCSPCREGSVSMSNVGLPGPACRTPGSQREPGRHPPGKWLPFGNRNVLDGKKQGGDSLWGKEKKTNKQARDYNPYKCAFCLVLEPSKSQKVRSRAWGGLCTDGACDGAVGWGHCTPGGFQARDVSVSSSPRNINTWPMGRASRPPQTHCAKRASYPVSASRSIHRCLALIYHHASECLGYPGEQEIRSLPSWS